MARIFLVPDLLFFKNFNATLFVSRCLGYIPYLRFLVKEVFQNTVLLIAVFLLLHNIRKPFQAFLVGPASM